MLDGSTVSLGARARALFALTKPRVLTLLLFTAATGAVIGSPEEINYTAILAALIGGALTAGGASAINIALEMDLDSSMKRTSERPVTSGVISQHWAAIYGLLLNFAGFVVLLLLANLLAATLAILGSLIYVGIYTLILKRTTVHNIVIGGAAGAMPPLVGYAAAAGSIGDTTALFLFAIVFFWTPPHFWALSLLIEKDYAKAGVPMLPVVQGTDATRLQIMLYTVLLTGLTLAFAAVTPYLGLSYLAGAIVLNGWFMWYAWRLYRVKNRSHAVRTYLYSLLYLFMLFALIGLSSILIGLGLPF